MEAIKLWDFSFSKKDMRIQSIPVDDIRPNPYQPRKYFHRSALEELAASIREYGVLQPVSVRRLGAGYELIAGERRLRAAELAGLATIPAILLDVSDSDSAMMAFVENLQRQDLNFLEEAEGYRSLMEDYGLTQEALALRVSKSQSAIANKLRILKLNDAAKKMILEHNLTERHARAVLRIPDERMRLSVLQQVVSDDLTVRRTEELIEETLKSMEMRGGARGEKKEKRIIADFRLFTNSIRQSVEIIRKSGLEVTYENEEGENAYEIVIRVTNIPPEYRAKLSLIATDDTAGELPA